MGQQAIQPRDLEILRALVRLRYLTSREINSAFFTSNDVGVRRVRALSRMDLIRPHTKGVPTCFHYTAWRLTAEGLAVVQKEFPHEPIADGLLELLSEGTLGNVHHREALSRVYLDFIRGPSLPPGEPDQAGVRARVATMRQRADAITWEPDGAVTLRNEGDDGGVRRIVPDATLAARARPVRIFLELDRSTKTLPRIEDCFDRYRRFLAASYETVYPDGKTPWVLFVVQSHARLAGVRDLAERVLGNGAPWEVRVIEDAPALLVDLLVGQPALGLAAPAASEAVLSGATALPRVAKRLYRWGRQLFAHINETGAADHLSQDLLAEGEQHLLALFEELQKDKASHAG
jgi:hypothetical protein